jgi:hypothetical protein
MSLSDIMSAAGLASWAEAGLVLSFVTFAAIGLRVLLARRTPATERLRRLPLEDVETPAPGGGGGAP